MKRRFYGVVWGEGLRGRWQFDKQNSVFGGVKGGVRGWMGNKQLGVVKGERRTGQSDGITRVRQVLEYVMCFSSMGIYA